MKTNHFTLVAVLVLGAMTLRAQTAPAGSPPDQANASPSAYPPPSFPMYGYGWNAESLRSGTSLAGALSVPYAFKWDAIGVSGELGGLWLHNHFFGGEVSYYDGNRQRYDVYQNGTYVGHFNSDQQVTTLQFAYRYFGPRWDANPWMPVSIYLGASGGAGYVNYGNAGAIFGLRNDDDWHWSGELVGGIQISGSPYAAFRLGYRYVAVNGVWRFDQNVNLASSVLEGGLTFRF